MSHLETDSSRFQLAGELAKLNTTHLLDKIVHGRIIGSGKGKIFFRTNIGDEKLKDVTNILSRMDECGVPVRFKNDFQGTYVQTNKSQTYGIHF